jgi:hypothetical protein
MIAGAAKYGNDTFVEFSGWVYATVPQASVMTLFWLNTAQSTTIGHPGDGWQFLRIGVYSLDGSGIMGRVLAADGVTNYFDNMSLVAKAVSPTPSVFARPAYLNSLATAPVWPVHP